MGLLGAILGLPFAPVRAVIALGEVIEKRVREELHDPRTARRELEEAERARAAGEITAEEEAEIQQAVLDRMRRPPGAKER